MSGVSIGEHTARVVAALHAADQLSTCGVLVWAPLGQWRRGAQMAAFTFLQLETGDYESWKRTFYSDPAGRKQRAQGHLVWRDSDNPNELFVMVEFASVDDAR